MSDEGPEDLFPCADESILNEDDHWKDVCAAVSPISAKSRLLAENLGLKSGDIDSIFVNFQNDKERLSEVLKYWLQLNFKYKKEGKPSWKNLAKSVHPINTDLALKIAEAHEAKGGKQSDRNHGSSVKRSRPSATQTSSQQDKRLVVKDLNDVVNAVWKIRAKFYNLGRNLDIDVGTLDVAKRRDDGEALNDVIKTWLQRSTPRPTWKAIIRALRSESVKEGALADEIARKYCPSELEPGRESDHDDENDSVTDGPPVPKRPHISEISPKKLEQNQDSISEDVKAEVTENTSRKENVQSWTVKQVAEYFYSTSDCKSFAQFCNDQEIDGDSLLDLTEDFLQKFGVKAGPAVKVMRHVSKLKTNTSPEQ